MHSFITIAPVYFAKLRPSNITLPFSDDSQDSLVQLSMASEQEEWTLALSKKTKRRGGRPSVPAEAVSKPNTIPRYTVEDLKTLRANARKIWQVSPERPKLIRLFKHQLDKYPHIIRKAICCGLGSADRAEPAPATHVTVFTQLEAFFDIVETIREYR